jgi:hypothetical protein
MNWESNDKDEIMKGLGVIAFIVGAILVLVIGIAFKLRVFWWQ